jgi:hypothetical protein
MRLKEIITEDVNEVDIKGAVKKGYEKVKQILTPKPLVKRNPLDRINTSELKVAIEKTLNAQPLDYPQTQVLKQLLREL